VIERPSRLQDWTLELVREIAASGMTENDWFDLKRDLQAKVDHQRKVVAAFANTQGGFLVFGVTNGRIVQGVENSELPRDFGNKLKQDLSPSVAFRFANPLRVSETAFVWICEVPRSQRGPHAVNVNDHWVFPRRTESGSNVSMNVEEIRLAFQDTEMRRSKLALVASELELIEAIAKRLLDNTPKRPLPGVNYWTFVTRYPTTLLDTLLGDAFALLASDTETWGALAFLRDAVRNSNTAAKHLGDLALMSRTGKERDIAVLTGQIRESAQGILANSALTRRRIVAVLGSDARALGADAAEGEGETA
jgi:hypothetical protein